MFAVLFGGLIMGFDLESSKNNEVNETPKVEITSEQLSETEETAENFDDCSLAEVHQDSKGNGVNAESLEAAEENYDDCEAKIEEMEEKNPELAEGDYDYDDFNDCGKEIDGKYVAEVIYITDGELSKEEVHDELQEAYNECDDPEDMQQLKDNANENEHVEVVHAEVVERPEDTTDEITEAEYEEAQEKLNEAQENLEAQQEVAQEYQEDLENQINNHESEVSEEIDFDAENEISENTEEAGEAAEVEENEIENAEVEETREANDDESQNEQIEENTDNTSESLKENAEDLEQMDDDSNVETSKIDEENLSENVSQEVEGEIDSEAKAIESVKEQSDAMDDEIERKAEEIAANETLTKEEAKEQISGDDVETMAEEKSDAIEDSIEEKKGKQESEQTEQSLQERIDSAFENEDVSSSEINSLRDEHAVELQTKIEEKGSIEAELKTKFDEVLSKEKGSDAYKQSLQEYNDLQDRKAMLDEQIAAMEKQQDLLGKKSLELREAQIQKGAEAMATSTATLAGVNMLQERYNQTYYDAKPDKTELASIRDDSSSSIKKLYAEKDSIKQAMDAKMDEMSEYVISNNMDRYETSNDLHYQKLTQEYLAMKSTYHKIDYSIVNLEENNKLIDEQIGIKLQESSENPVRAFGQYEIDNHGFVKGKNFEQYIQSWENYSSESHKIELFEDGKTQTISPSLVEGIPISDYDANNPSAFWSHHEPGGTEKSFEEIARNIPEVQSRLKNGETLENLLQDPKVGMCTAIYFHPDKMPKVIKCGDYYEFQTNGRHRILAARNVGCDIPVKIIGERKIVQEAENNDAIEHSLYNDLNDIPVPEEYESLVLKSNQKDDIATKSKELSPRTTNDSKEYTSIIDSLEKSDVEYRPIQLMEQKRTTQDIIARLSGGDMTKGSCSSLALAYAGNKAGYDVLDFRDGDSRSFFSSRNSIQIVADMPGIRSTVLNGTNDIETANQLLSSMQEGNEYYLATGGHAAIVRRNGDVYQYLELQHPSNGNGWHTLEDNILRQRFGCRETRSSACSSFLMDVDSLANSVEFRNILGFINTAESNQRKGAVGNVR